MLLGTHIGSKANALNAHCCACKTGRMSVEACAHWCDGQYCEPHLRLGMRSDFLDDWGAPVEIVASPRVNRCSECDELIPARTKGRAGRNRMTCSDPCRQKRHRQQMREGAKRTRERRRGGE